MKERIHEQISQELKAATRADLVTMIVALVVIFTLSGLAFGFSFGTTGAIAGSLLGGAPGFMTRVFNTMPTIIMFVGLLAIFAVAWFSVRTILNNKKQRAKLNEGLMNLYKDEGVDKYYDGSIFKSYEGRYNLFSIILGVVGAVSIIVPLVIFFNNIIEM